MLGIAGVTAGWEEGFELNVLGLTLGLDPKSLAVKLPLVGSLGPKGPPGIVMIPQPGAATANAAQPGPRSAGSTPGS